MADMLWCSIAWINANVVPWDWAWFTSSAAVQLWAEPLVVKDSNCSASSSCFSHFVNPNPVMCVVSIFNQQNMSWGSVDDMVPDGLHCYLVTKCSCHRETKLKRFSWARNTQTENMQENVCKCMSLDEGLHQIANMAIWSSHPRQANNENLF